MARSIQLPELRASSNAGRNIQTIVFDGGAGAFTLSEGQGSYSFTNNSTTAANVLDFDAMAAISLGVKGNSTLTLNGANTGTTIISNSISNGGGCSCIRIYVLIAGIENTDFTGLTFGTLDGSLE